MTEGRYAVTGANRGIGLAIAAALTAQGRSVALVCRDPVAGEAARAALPGAALVCGDLATPDGVASVARGLAAKGPLAALVHNAGLWPTTLVRDDRGVERSFAVNHLAPFHLTALLWDRLVADGARIVCVNAGLYALGRPDLADAETGRRFSRWRTYCDTKLCGARFVVELARRAPGAPVVAVHPGVINTGRGDDGGWLSRWLLRPVKRRWRSPEDGARAPVALATDPDLAASSGRFFFEEKPQPWKNGADDPDLAAALWARSEALCGLRFLG